eukprot:366416-Chlamydomonas_euryale.AAC.6
MAAAAKATHVSPSASPRLRATRRSGNDTAACAWRSMWLQRLKQPTGRTSIPPQRRLGKHCGPLSRPCSVGHTSFTWRDLRAAAAKALPARSTMPAQNPFSNTSVKWMPLHDRTGDGLLC